MTENRSTQPVAENTDAVDAAVAAAKVSAYGATIAFSGRSPFLAPIRFWPSLEAANAGVDEYLSDPATQAATSEMGNTTWKRLSDELRVCFNGTEIIAVITIGRLYANNEAASDAFDAFLDSLLGD